MNLAARGAGRQREDFVMRLGCFLVSFAVLASLVLLPPKAKAFAMTSSAVTALAGGFLSACGLTPVVSGMGSSEEVNESVARLIQDFLNEEVGGISVADWALSFGEIGLAVKDKRIVIPKPFAEKLGQFAQWVAGKYGTKPGENVIYQAQKVFLADGTEIKFGSFVFDVDKREFILLDPSGATPFSFDTWYELSNGNQFCYSLDSDLERIYPKYIIDGHRNDYTYTSVVGGVSSNIYYILAGIDARYGSDTRYMPVFLVSSGYMIARVYMPSDFPMLFSLVNESISLNVAETITIPEGLTDSQSVALDVGATDSMSIQEILQGILDAILAGDLAASAEIVDTAEVPVDPEEPDPPVVPVVPSGLDKLGAALTSRFPFSIPWDVYKGVTLLAAPPKAPYFEVDFMAPIADRVGGWKGSTKIVLDFSEYEIIGQVCRWTSTIGFCLMLASGTKRLIWTA